MEYQGETSGYLQEALERRILHGLRCEWDAAVSFLAPAYQYKMQPPFLAVSGMKKTLGKWIPEKREIMLSRNLVMNHSWDAVMEVLHHEMAHQMADEVLGRKNEPPHGRTFQKACGLLRANPEASGDYPPLHERLHTRSRYRSEDRIMIRVKKLMALSESSNRFEAESAMSKAHSLIAKHNIDLIQTDRNRSFTSIYLGKPALRHSRDAYALSNLLQEYYFVRSIWTTAYVLEKKKMGRVLEVSGMPHNLLMAEYVYAFVRNYIAMEWRKYNQDKGLNHFRKIDFSLGVVDGFKMKLDSEKKRLRKTDEDVTALVKMEDPLLKAYIKYRYPHLVSVSRKSARHDPDVIDEGVKAGKKLVISKGIATRETSLKRIPHRTIE